MCPLYPFHIILLYLCLLLPLLLAVVEGSDILADWHISFRPREISKLMEKNMTQVQINYDKMVTSDENVHVVLRAENPDLISLQKYDVFGPEISFNVSYGKEASGWSDMFNVSANFLGFTEIWAEIRRDRDEVVLASKSMPVSIVRKKTIQSKLFSYSVAALISLAYINMGCALDLQVIKDVIKRPIGPAIGFFCQFIIMPLISFGLGFIFPASESAMRLGLFVTGISPGGGASNIWTLMFGGNLNLSITMTAISTFSAFFMMPLWIFTLGPVIFSESNIKIPYEKICTYAFCLVVPLAIGIAIARYLPRVSKFLVKILKPMALFLILFIITFGIWANLYIFRLMTWRVFLTGMGLPWLGFAFGCLSAKLCRRSNADTIAIAIETGIQNTGVSIFILWFTLDHPLGDLTAVIPVAAATMTPIPLLMGLICLKIRDCFTQKSAEDSAGKYESAASSDDDVAHGHMANGNGYKDDIKESESKQKLMNNGGITESNGHVC